MERKIYVISLPGKCGRVLLLWTLEEKKTLLEQVAAAFISSSPVPPTDTKRTAFTFMSSKSWAYLLSRHRFRTLEHDQRLGTLDTNTWKNILIRWRVKGSCLFLASSHLRCVCCVTSLQQELWPQRGGEALRQRVAVLARHDQMEGRAELGEGESSVPVHVTQLPETQEEQRSLQMIVGTTANEHNNFSNFSILMQVWKKNVFSE